MGIRLLPKSELIKAKTKDRELEITEGAKLAKRVDDLRKLVADEETNLTKFREKTVSAIMADVKVHSDELDGIKEEIRTRKAELIELFEPIDKQFMRYVRDKKAELDGLELQAEEKAAVLAATLSEAGALIENNKKLEGEWKQKHQDAVDNIALSQNMVAAAKKEAARTGQDAQNILLEAEKIRKDALNVASDANARLKQAEFKEKDLNRKEEELETREMAALAKELLYYSPVKKN